MDNYKYPYLYDDVIIGNTYKTTKDGDILIISKSSKQSHFIVRFTDTGNEYDVIINSIKKGLVRDNKKDRTQEFIDSCNEKHNYKYSYNNTVYKGAREKVTITCPVHGDIEVHASCHRNGSGCKQCACIDINKYTTEQFIEKSKLIFGDKFSYEKSVYNGNSVRIIVTCSEHGDVEITPMNHYTTATGCPECVKDYLVRDVFVSFSEFKDRANSKHGNKYLYDEDSYTRYSKKVRCFCGQHGWWRTTAHNHATKGTACPLCATSGFKRLNDAFVYVLISDSMVKVGITNNSVELRCSQINEGSPEKFAVFSYYLLNGSQAYEVEQNVLTYLRSIKTKQPESKFTGYTEAFLIDVKTIDELVRKYIKELYG